MSLISLFHPASCPYFFQQKLCSLPVIAKRHRIDVSDIRTILSTFRSASLTLEASLSFTFYLLVCISLSFFISIIGIQQTFQMQLEETSRKLNNTAYISLDTSTDSWLFSPQAIRQIFVTDEIRDICSHLHITGGAMGLSFSNSSTDMQNQTCDIILSYEVEIPFLPDSHFKVPMTQHCRFKLFTGAATTSPVAYITANASVYHTDRYCSYLLKYTDVISAFSLPEYEKRTGITYSLCHICSAANKKDTSTLYICANGRVYHYSRECYHLTCDIYEIPLSQARTYYPLCSRCKNN